MAFINTMKDACSRVLAVKDAQELLMEYARAWATDNGHELYYEKHHCTDRHQYIDFCKPLNESIVEIGIAHEIHYPHGTEGGTSCYFVDLNTDTELEYKAVKHLLED